MEFVLKANGSQFVSEHDSVFGLFPGLELMPCINSLTSFVCGCSNDWVWVQVWPQN